MFSVDWDEAPRYTAVPDVFITKYMPEAPGEYVKVFLYLLSVSGKNEPCKDTDDLGRMLNMSESEARASLKYWEEKKLLDIFYKSGNIAGIKIRLSSSEQARGNHRLNPLRVKNLMAENKDAQTLCYVTEQYLSRPLTATEIGTLLYFLDELKFPVDLCEYLVEYCISKGHPSIRYIEKVGLSWHKNGYSTVEEARGGSSAWSKIHFDVLKAFGISGRNPVKKEIEYIDKWYKNYCLSLDIISEACSITLSNTGKQSFEYADRILSRWHESGVKTLNDIKAAGKDFRAKQTSADGRKNSKNQFLNYEQRNDYLEDLERRLDKQFAEFMEGENGSD